MLLTTVESEQAPEEARYLLTRTSQEVPQTGSRDIIDMLTTIIMYRFEQLSQREVELMLGITLQKSRAYQEIKEEGREEGRQEEAANLIVRILTKQFGKVPQEMGAAVSGLPRPVLEELSEALLDFASLADLQIWLED
jgi:predicted transposase YdaD